MIELGVKAYAKEIKEEERQGHTEVTRSNAVNK